MNKALTLALAAVFSTASIGGIAVAQETTTTTTPMAAPMAMTEEMVSIIVVSEPLPDDGQTEVPETYKNASPETISSAQTEIQADPALMDILVKKNVQIENVVGIQTAANGGKVVYVK
ncbi:hypothetical protein [Pararhizobium antarcticum]|uniref:Uncharacterized protein n=1 Tax=Pararhizobium antarcticum TaxID=1798805 RepID=A0A657LTJ5_9HYPH|nr:hypothetical protein [Pararhizobium antarcticum]OJF92680.1 hypothetical protein AX761_21010 [Rhizobium sp. 58]OJF96766.1 hypothetical protein AX760_02510 [Pararhizobium antarcticum]